MVYGEALKDNHQAIEVFSAKRVENKKACSGLFCLHAFDSQVVSTGGETLYSLCTGRG